MRRQLFYIGFLILLIACSCERQATNPEPYFTATIDGEKFQASHVNAIRQDLENSNSFEIYASNRDIFDSEFSHGAIPGESDYRLFLFSFQNDCLEERLFTWDEIQADTSCATCIYEFFDSSIKAIYPEAMHSNGFIEISSLAFEENGIIAGSFEITGRNTNELEYADTIYITDGEFRMKFKN